MRVVEEGVDQARRLVRERTARGAENGVARPARQAGARHRQHCKHVALRRLDRMGTAYGFGNVDNWEMVLQGMRAKHPSVQRA